MLGVEVGEAESARGGGGTRTKLAGCSGVIVGRRFVAGGVGFCVNNFSSLGLWAGGFTNSVR